MQASSQIVVVDDHPIKLTNLDKVLYPATGTTKGEVIGYYQAVAPWFISHAAGRPATRKRWPNGVGTAEQPQTPFFHKNLDPKSTPEWVRTFTIDHKDGANSYPLIDEAATLVWLAQLASLELHTPQWRVDADGVPLPPDRLILDLDPGEGAGMEACVELAHLIREVLAGAGFASFPVTSGSKGIHLYTHLDGSMTSDEASAWARELAGSLEQQRPDLVVSDMKKAVRQGKVLLDWSQNNAGKTTVAPYSLRGLQRPTVAAPRSWDEITPDLRQLEFAEVIERLDQIGDPLAGLDAALSAVVAAPAPRPQLRLHQAQPPAEPTLIEPMLASPGSAREVSRPGWRFEVKWDGYRAVATVADGRATFRSRGGNDLSANYPELAELTGLVGDRQAVVDGEIVVLDEAGRPSFELLQNHAKNPGSARYMAFDLLHLDGESLLRRPYLERRAALHELLGVGGNAIHVPDDLGADAEVALAASADLGLEGVVAKADASVYQPGRRAHTWVKIKHLQTQDVIVVGWTPGENARARTLGALLMAVPGPDGLAYVGRVGSGFTEQVLRDSHAVLSEIEIDHPPLVGVPPADAKGAHWVEPLLVGEVSYAQLLGAGRLRFPVWNRWRPDLTVEDVAWRSE